MGISKNTINILRKDFIGKTCLKWNNLQTSELFSITIIVQLYLVLYITFTPKQLLNKTTYKMAYVMYKSLINAVLYITINVSNA